MIKLNKSGLAISEMLAVFSGSLFTLLFGLFIFIGITNFTSQEAKAGSWQLITKDKMSNSYYACKTMLSNNKYQVQALIVGPSNSDLNTLGYSAELSDWGTKDNTDHLWSATSSSWVSGNTIRLSHLMSNDVNNYLIISSVDKNGNYARGSVQYIGAGTLRSC